MSRRKKQEDFPSTTKNDSKDSYVYAPSRFMFDHFDPEEEEWEYYIQRFEIELSLHNITSKEIAKTLLLSKIGAKPFKLLADHFRPALVNSQTYEDITKVLFSYYNDTFCTLGERVTFGRRYRQDGETISQYLNTLRSIAGRCQFGTSLDERLRDQLLLGINNNDWQKELLRQHTDTQSILKDVETSALILEQADKTQKTICTTKTENHISHLRKTTFKKHINTEETQKIHLFRGKHCFRCGE